MKLLKIFYLLTDLFVYSPHIYWDSAMFRYWTYRTEENTVSTLTELRLSSTLSITAVTGSHIEYFHRLEVLTDCVGAVEEKDTKVHH